RRRRPARRPGAGPRRGEHGPRLRSLRGSAGGRSRAPSRPAPPRGSPLRARLPGDPRGAPPGSSAFRRAHLGRCPVSKTLDWEDRLKTYLTQNGLRLTRQRRIIAEAFFEGEGHPDIEELYERVRAI